MNYTEEQLNEAYEKMPVHLQGILGDENLGFVIQAIGRENGITPEQSLDIEYLVIHTLLGLRKLDNLARNIRDDFKIEGEVAWKIARDIQKDIFSEVEDSKEDLISEPAKETPSVESAEDLNGMIAKPPKVPLPTPPNKAGNNTPKNIPILVEQESSHPFEEKLRAAQKDMSGAIPYKGIPDPYRARME